MRQIAYRLILVLFNLVLMEAAARIGSHVLAAKQANALDLAESQKDIIEEVIEGDSDYVVYDGDLGWTIRPGARAQMYAANGFGIRSSRDYDYQRIPAGVHRIAAFGDSYIHADNVRNEQAWPAQVEQLDPQYEVLNFGVSAYGLDQAYLRFLENADRFKANTVIIGMMSEDVYRHINTFRAFHQPGSALPLGKPRFLLDGDGLSEVPNYFSSIERYQELLEKPQQILPIVGEHDYYYNHGLPPADCAWTMVPCFARQIYWWARTIDRDQKDPRSAFLQYDLDAEGPKVTLQLIKAFADAVRQRGMQPVLVLFPYKTDYVQFRLAGTTTYRGLLAQAEKMGIPSWDALDALKAHGSLNVDFGDVFDGHYTPAANRLIARWIVQKMKTSNFTSPPRPQG